MSGGSPTSAAARRVAPEGRQGDAFRAAVWGQCFGVQPQLALIRGLGLLYLNALGVPAGGIVALLSASFLVRGVLSIPAGYWADRAGKRRLGVAGQLLAIGGFGLLAAAPWVGSAEGTVLFLPASGGTAAGWPLYAVVALGIGVFGAGTALFGGGWFALLSPLLPPASRGRYLGRMRFIRQLAAIAFGALVAASMTEATPLGVFQLVFAGLTLCLVIRLWFYRRIPELEATAGARPGFAAAIREVLAIPGYRRFCALVLAMFLAVGAVPMVFGLLELEVLAMGDALVWWLGVAITGGHLAGSLAAGPLVDRAGGRLALALCQGAFILSMALLLTRGWGLPAFWRALAASALFGLARSALDITVTAELLGRVPRANKALAVSLCGTVIYLGESLAGLSVAWVLTLGTLGPLAAAAGSAEARYDAVLMGLVTLLALLLPLTPFALSRREGAIGR